MAQALYDPETGYYARRITGVGRRGDFTTAPMLSEAPARAIAAWVARALRESGTRDLIEIGPGEGTLVAAVLKLLPWSVRLRLGLHLVETSQPLAERQQKLLGKQACWHRGMTDALTACKGRAVIFSNELVDAFPVKRFEKTETGWREIAVCRDADGFAVESLIPVADLPPSSGFREAHANGQRIEVHDSYRRYLTEWLPHWQAGRMLTIDYGATSEKLYQRQRNGSIRGYLMQQVLTGLEIYQNAGRQDLTADVNFTDLQTWSGPWVTTQRLMSLKDFLTDGLQNEIAGVCALLEDHGAGDAFQVLEQSR
ncbi:MAG: SAM-dependent methyltransferase [Armatimonadetes bacterium]|nr:SAM-dependent methyltransferase [Akkermansiaceae bacterium]